MYQILTPPALVLAGFRGALVQDVPGLNFVYDPGQTWVTAALSQRQQITMQEGTADTDGLASVPTEFPVMGWSRDPIKRLEPLGRRAPLPSYLVEVQALNPDGTPNAGVYDTWKLRAVVGQLNLTFRLYGRDILEMEALELGYAARGILSGITGFDIPVDSLYPALDLQAFPNDLWHYDVIWNDLTDLVAADNVNVAMNIGASCEIHGVFLTGQVATVPYVTTIALSIRDLSHRTVLDTVVVHKSPT